MASEARISRSALQHLPVFPLPGAVLFPGAVLPLHVFEPRYRALAADVLAGPKLLAVVRLRPGYEADYHGRPPIFDIAGVGYVFASDHLEDGRYNLILRGIGRVAIESELPPRRLYREVCARELLASRTARPQELSALHSQLVTLCDRLADHLEEGGDELRQLVRNTEAPGSCVDLLAAALVTEPDERQALLEMLDPADRVDRVLDHLGRLAGRLGTTPDVSN